MKIVVFGATGMIGTRIAAELEQRGHGAADMLARNPRGEDTRWQSG